MACDEYATVGGSSLTPISKSPGSLIIAHITHKAVTPDPTTFLRKFGYNTKKSFVNLSGFSDADVEPEQGGRKGLDLTPVGGQMLNSKKYLFEETYETFLDHLRKRTRRNP